MKIGAVMCCMTRRTCMQLYKFRKHVVYEDLKEQHATTYVCTKNVASVSMWFRWEVCNSQHLAKSAGQGENWASAQAANGASLLFFVFPKTFGSAKSAKCSSFFSGSAAAQSLQFQELEETEAEKTNELGNQKTSHGKPSWKALWAMRLGTSLVFSGSANFSIKTICRPSPAGWMKLELKPGPRPFQRWKYWKKGSRGRLKCLQFLQIVTDSGNQRRNNIGKIFNRTRHCGFKSLAERMRCLSRRWRQSKDSDQRSDFTRDSPCPTLQRKIQNSRCSSRPALWKMLKIKPG